MITPLLEKMIHEGQAAFRTYTAGGAEKSVLSVNSGRYIVIVDITYFPRIVYSGVVQDYLEQYAITQLFIGSSRRQNTIQFRNSISASYDPDYVGMKLFPGAAIKMDTYFIHDSDVCFSFTDAEIIDLGVASVTPADGVGFEPPLDYGTAVTKSATAIHQRGIYTISPTVSINFAGRQIQVAGNQVFQDLKYPARSIENDTWLPGVPLAQINYVEVFSPCSNTLMK